MQAMRYSIQLASSTERVMATAAHGDSLTIPADQLYFINQVNIAIATPRLWCQGSSFAYSQGNWDQPPTPSGVRNSNAYPARPMLS